MRFWYLTATAGAYAAVHIFMQTRNGGAGLRTHFKILTSPSKVVFFLSPMADVNLQQVDNNSSMITIIIADDQPAVRHGLRMRLSLEPDLQVIGAAQDGNNTLSVVARLKPDIVIMDLEMSIMDGLTATRELLSLVPDCRIIMLTIHDDERTRRQAQDSGAAGFVSKHEGDMVLLDAIRAAANRSGGR